MSTNLDGSDDARSTAPSNRGRIGLIIGLMVVLVVIVVVFLFLLLPRATAPTPGATSTATPSSTPTSIPTPTPTPPSPSPVASPPPPSEPDLVLFRDRMTPLLDDAATGLGFVAESGTPEDVAAIVEQLQIDAQRMSEAIPPSSLAVSWPEAVSAYGSRLDALRAAGAGSESAAALEAARERLEDLRNLLGA